MQLTVLEVDGLPGEPEYLGTAELQSVDQDPGSEEVIFASQGVSEEAARFHHGLIRRWRGLGALTREATFLVDLLLGHDMRQCGRRRASRGA